MAFKFIVLCSLLAIANAGVLTPTVHYSAYANPAVDAVASTQQNVVRSFDGTVSTYSKAIDTPYSSVRKEDTRISNNVYTPSIEKSFTYSAAPVAKVTYAAPAVVEKKTFSTYAAAPVAKTITYAAPIVQKAAVTYAAPAVTKTIVASAPTPVYTHASLYSHPSAPSANFYTHSVPKVVESVVAKPLSAYATATPLATTIYNHGPAATTYTHNAPGVTGYGASQTVHYSPAEMVSHMSFDGFGTHWGY